MVCAAGLAQAQEPGKAMSQYIRDHWGVEKGFPGGQVYAITQTPDGYLWIGTEKGLVRFDGLTFRLFQQSSGAVGPSGPVLGLTADADGNLWVRLQGAALLRYRDGKFEDTSSRFDRAESTVTAMGRGKDGEPLFSALRNGTLRYEAGKFSKLAPNPRLPNFIVISLAEMPDGKIWMGTRDTGLFHLDAGQVSASPKELRDRKINCLLPSGTQELWIGTDNGLARWNGTDLVKTGLPPPLEHAQILAMTKDRDANVWVGTSEGLYRIDPADASHFNKRDDFMPNEVTALFEDREGNLWTGSTKGIDRLRDTAFTTYSISEGLPSESNGPVYVDVEGRTWFAPSEGGLLWLKGGNTERVATAGLENDVIYSITGGKGGLWIGRQRGGLTHIGYKSGALTAETYTHSDGLAQNGVYAVHQNRDGSVWAGTLNGGVSKFKSGSFTAYTTANGLLSNSINSILESSNGTMWFATPKGLSAFSNDRWLSYTERDGLPSEDVNCLLEDATGVLWLGTAKGLASIRSGSVSLPGEVPESLREPIFGIAQDRGGSLWIATSNHVLRVDRGKLLAGTLGDEDVREFGLDDGLRGTEGVKRNRSVVADQFGRIWFSMNRGLSFVDPTRVNRSTAPTIVHITGISADGNPINLQGPTRIPAGSRRVTFSYTGLNLSVPERVRFKYKLDSFDQGWSGPVATNTAVYTNLSPGPYRFRIIASNSDGTWNSAESAISFKIEPQFWQTWWFRLSSVLIAGLAVLLFFRLRVMKLTRQMNMRFEERLAERTRIAQELHDTLLQGVLSASMQLHVADEHLPTDSPAKPYLGRVLELMGHVIDEGRNAVRGLRLPNKKLDDLEQAFSDIQKELCAQPGAVFRILVEGEARPLHPVVREEVYWIGREALVNAFRHSGASDIELELEYAAGHFRLLVRDNGSGIDPQVARTGRAGHWGLSGMRERAERIGARFRVLSGALAGTEIELSLPGHIAFEYSSAPSRWEKLSKLHLRRSREEQPKAENEIRK
jgi:ligand-binding sensor domain-containing protein